jgi:hypothetical protein
LSACAALAGRGLYAIAEGLTRDGILSPSSHDPQRNPHRRGSAGAWSKAAVRAILHNPRYTGHQVWNRQRREEALLSVDDVARGHQTRMGWNPQSQWIWSEDQTHPGLVDLDTFHAVQQVFGGAQRAAVRRE